MAEKETVKKRIILSFQPFSVYGNGGGPRIMRRLVEGRESEVIFFSFSFKKDKLNEHPNEIKYILFPPHKTWMRSFVRTFFTFLRNKVFLAYNIRRSRAIVSKLSFDVMHILDHSFYSSILLPLAIKKKVPVWVSFHDHFISTQSNSEVTRDLWLNASKRMVISPEMGEHYSELFGKRDYMIVTDGLKPYEIAGPKPQINRKQIKVYFGGLLHFDYYELFRKFSITLGEMALRDNVEIEIILRGTQKLNFLDESLLKVDYRPFSIDHELLANEMNEADILYLPIKYNDPTFYKYSFSTKMIGYLGASGNIFYHGPEDAAAARFLLKNDCGVICDSLDEKEILVKFEQSISDNKYSVNAKAVALRDFQMKMMQDRFFE